MIHLVLGSQGSGKTLFCVNRAYRYYRQGMKVYSNVHLNFPYEPLNYNDIIDCRLNNCMVLIDEGHLLLPARGSATSKINKAICDGFISQIRKANVELYITTQTLRKIDIRIRDEMTYCYFAERHVLIDGSFAAVPYTHKTGEGTPTIIKLEIKNMETEKWIDYPIHANPYYNMYDSAQKIKIVGLEDGKKRKKTKA